MNRPILLFATLAVLRQLDPTFGSFLLLHRDDLRIVDPDFGNLAPLIAASVMATGRPGDYEDAAVDGTLLPHTRSVIGFSAMLFAQSGSEPPGELAANAITLTFNGAAGLFGVSQTRIEFPELAPWTDRARLRAVLAAPDRAGADWIIYICRPSVTACLPPHTPFESIQA